MGRDLATPKTTLTPDVNYNEASWPIRSRAKGADKMIVHEEFTCAKCGRKHTFRYARDPGDQNVGEICNNCGEPLSGPPKRWATEDGKVIDPA